ncbi:hypothetical protein [Sporocytophaga myxococcoides]|uniref:hypothetical protein n=1 Tax=Sporocytophaga myxococcoides TaxID=153721 RepID=UPI0003F50873|nr:hypothetical protein [Sporocytophaga myxococcoides]
MKTSLVIFFTIFISQSVSGQFCDCKKKEVLKQIISCEPKVLDNNSFNCDSSWLTFENSKLTTRIGQVYFKEFKNTYLYTNKVNSGCCDPVDYYLYDKTTGNLIKYLGGALYVSDSISSPFIVTITNSNYDKYSMLDFNSLTIYNLDTRKEYKIEFDKGQIEKGIDNNNYMFPEYIFDETEIINDTLILKYHIDKYIKGKEIKEMVFKIDLKKYSS